MTTGTNETTSPPAAKPEKKPGKAAGNARKPVPEAGAGSDGGQRAATVASRIEHDGEAYAPEDLILLTEAQFDELQPTGALVEKTWDGCTEL